MSEARNDEIAEFCGDGKTHDEIMFEFTQLWQKSESTVAKAIAEAVREGRIVRDNKSKEYKEVK